MIQIMAEWQIDKQLNWTDWNSTLIMQVADHDDDKNYVMYRGFVVHAI